MKSYDLPGDTSLMEPEDAKRAKNKFRADVLADRDHPYNVGSTHPQFEDFSAHYRTLNSIIQQGEADAQADATAQELAEALGEDAGLSAPECLARAESLLRSDGYISQTMPQAQREKLTKKIHALHTAASQQETSTPADQENDDDLS